MKRERSSQLKMILYNCDCTIICSYLHLIIYALYSVDLRITCCNFFFELNQTSYQYPRFISEYANEPLCPAFDLKVHSKAAEESLDTLYRFLNFRRRRFRLSSEGGDRRCYSQYAISNSFCNIISMP